MDFLHFSYCPLAFILSLATTENSLAPFSSLSPIMCLNTSRLNSPSSLSLFFYMRCSEALTTFTAPHWTCSSTSMSSHNGELRTGLSSCVSPGLSRGKGSFHSAELLYSRFVPVFVRSGTWNYSSADVGLCNSCC